MKKELKILLCRGVAVRRLITGVFAGLLLILCTSYLNAKTWTVTNCKDDGTSCTLRYAVRYAQPGDTINFSPATDGHPIVLSDAGQLSVYQGISIIGNGPDKTIVDGNQKDQVFSIYVNANLKNMTIEGGNNTRSGCGSGVYNYGKTTITNCVISNNQNWILGGGIYNSGNLTLINSVITNNTAVGNGGGICNCAEPPDPQPILTLINCTVSNNTSYDDSSGHSFGGGIFNEGSLTMANTTVDDNEASYSAGIYNGGNASLINSTIVNNVATQAYGGIYNEYNDPLVMTNCTVANNIACPSKTASNHSGGGICNEGNLTIVNTICANNYSSTTKDDFINLNGSVTDNGYNIIGFSIGHVWDVVGDWAGNANNDTYTEAGTGGKTTGQLSLASNLTYNGGANLTLVPGPGSIAIDNGTDSGTPNTDQRGYIRKSTPDIGAYETGGMVAYNTRTNDSYSTIQDAIAAASSNDTIKLVAAQIKEFGINVDKNVIIEGAGSDTTYVQADLTPGTATDRIFNITSGATLDSMTIRNGDTSSIGGGILYSATGTNLYINNCVVSDNTASEGGGIASTDGALNLLNSMVLDNCSMSVNGDGGGILCEQASIQNSTIASNHSYGNGGGIEAMEYSNCIDYTNIINSTIFDNSAAGTGGGIDLSGSDILNIYNSTVAGNSAATGGGINLEECNLLIIRNTIIANNKGQNDFNSSGGLVIDGNYNVVGFSNNHKWGSRGDWTEDNTGTFTNNGGKPSGQLFLASALADNGGPTLTLNFTDPSSIAVNQGAIPKGIINYNLSPNADQRGVVRTGNYTAIGAYNDNQSGNY